MLRLFLLTAVLMGSCAGVSADGNSLQYLHENNPWYPHTGFPKLTTPQWVGEEGVDAVVVLAIDDMRDTAKYEAYLRPILQRLKQIDGRAPVSIMTCNVKPDDPQLQTWIDEGLSIEVHTVDHPCPILQGGDLAKAKSTYDRCVDLLGQIPGNKPVAFRTPCCDSLNTVSPRFFAEIFNQTTEQGNYLSLSSSVFSMYTSADPEIPKELVTDADGREKFRKYIPKGMKRNGIAQDNFVNLIENYPYPYVINDLCWEFPCMVPSDWEAQFLQQPNNPETVEDMKTALDITVLKKGVFNLVFHPHGWIKAEQVVELIDHAVTKHGKKVKFLNFREAHDRLNENLLAGQPLRQADGADNGVRLLDVNRDGFMDVVIGNSKRQSTRIWDIPRNQWREQSLPTQSVASAEFGVLYEDGRPTLLTRRSRENVDDPASWDAWMFSDDDWEEDKRGIDLCDTRRVGRRALPHIPGDSYSFDSLRDVDGDGISEAVLVGGLLSADRTESFVRFRRSGEKLRPQSQQIPDHFSTRWRDFDGDGDLDILVGEALYFFEKDSESWGEFKKVMLPQSKQLSPLSALRFDGTDNGFFFHSGHLCWQNEFTADLPDMMHRVSVEKLLRPLKIEQGAVSPLKKPDANASADAFPLSKSPEESLATIQLAPGLKAELVAAEPLIQDPVAFEWDVQGRLWVVQMGGYPNGATDADGKPTSGGEIRVLEDVDNDGKYDKATTFLDGLNFPTGIHRWRNGVIVTDAPTIFYAEDTDGDLKADVRKTLYDGFVEGNQQHRVNGLRWGLDNWLHVANGDSGGNVRVVGKVGEGDLFDDESKFRVVDRDPFDPVHEVIGPGRSVNIRGRDVRIQPDYGLIDTVSGQSQFGRCRDDWGNWFGGNNSRPMWHYSLDDRYIRRNPHAAAGDSRREIFDPPGASPVFPISNTMERFNDHDRANRFTSACSAMFYRDSLLGEEFAGDAFVCEPVHNLVSRRIVTEENGVFTARRSANEKSSEFLASSDSWFRPVMVRTGPDGALWVADMYRFVIEHPEWIPSEWQEKLNLQAGNKMGRIYRIVRDENSACCGVANDEATGTSPGSDDRRRDWLAKDWDEIPPAEMISRLSSPNGWWRDAAQRILVHRVEEKFDRSTISELATKSPNPATRLQALCTLVASKVPTSYQTTIAAFDDTHPAVRRHAARLRGPSWQVFSANDPLKKDPLNSYRQLAGLVDDPDYLVRMQLAYSADQFDPTVGAATFIVKHSDDKNLIAAVFSSLDAANIEAVLDNVKSRSKPENGAMTRRLTVQAAALGRFDIVTRQLKQQLHRLWGEEWVDSLEPTVDLFAEIRTHDNAWKRLKESKEWKQTSILGEIRIHEARIQKLVEDSTQPDQTRVAGIRFLAATGILAAEKLLWSDSLLNAQNPPKIQSAIIEALGQSDDSRVPNLLLSRWTILTPAVRRQIVDTLAQRNDWTLRLLESVDAGQVATNQLDAAQRERLVTHRDAGIRERAAKLFDVEASSDRQALIEEFEPVLKLASDETRGRVIFEKRCSSCHRLRGIGKSIGADLAALKDRTGNALLTAILDPNRAVEAKFLSYTAVTNAGKVVSGMLLSETGNSVTLVSTDGKEHVLLRKDLEQLVSSQRSLMPEGLEKDLSRQDIADVIAFVQTSGLKPKELPFNAPAEVVPSDDGVVRLPASVASVFGPSLIVEEHFRNLGNWLSDKDHAAWTIVLPESSTQRTFDVEFDFACHRSAAGNQLVLSVAGQTLEGRVPSTNRWDRYSTWKPGAITLPPGASRLAVFTRSLPVQALIDLREIRLIPRGE